MEPSNITSTSIAVGTVLSFRLLEPIPVGAGWVMSLCPQSASVLTAFVLADLRLLLKKRILGGEVPLLVSKSLKSRLNLGVSSLSDGAFGEGVAGGEWLLLALDREKNDGTRFVGDAGALCS